MFTRRIAPNIRERHARSCGRSLGAGRCTCEPSYIARVTLGGTRRVETFTDASDAMNWVKEMRRALRQGHSFVGPVPTVARAAELFMQRTVRGEALTRNRTRFADNTIATYERDLRLKVLRHRDAPTGRLLGELLVDQVDARTIQRFVDAEIGRSGPQSARHAAAALSSLLRDLYVQGVVDTLPPKVLLPPPGPARDIVLTPEEYERFLDGCRQDDERFGRSLLFPLVALLGGSGCRVSEALALRWGPGGVELEGDAPRLLVQRETTKTEAGRRAVALDHETVAILADHRARSGNPPVGEFVFQDARRRRVARSGAVRFGMERASALAGLRSVTPHVLRHSHATWAASANVPAVALAARLGHRDAGFTLRRYAHAAQTDLAAIPDAVLRHRQDRIVDSKKGYEEPVPEQPPQTADVSARTPLVDRPPNRSARVNRPGLVERYERDVLPALQGRLADAFPEFGWRRDRDGWRAGNDEFTHQRLGVRADRVVCHGDAPPGFLVHGQGPVMWTTYVNGGAPARGRDFADAVRAIADRAGVQLDVDRSPTARERREQLIADTFTICREAFHSDAGDPARAYLVEERGFPAESLDSLNLGVMPKPEALAAALAARGYSTDEIAAARVLGDSRWTGRLVGVWNDERGRSRTLWARAIVPTEPRAARYLYLPGARRPDVPYGLDGLLARGTASGRSLVLVEGVIDVHHLRARGFQQVAALGGTAGSPQMFERLATLGFETVTLALDADAAGRKATITSIEAAYRGLSPAIDVVRLTKEKDPDALMRSSGLQAWSNAVRASMPAISWRVEQMFERVDLADRAATRTAVHRAGAWLGTLDARYALEQDTGVRTVAACARLDLDATRRAFRTRYWSPTIGVDPG
jgi:integrase